MVLGIFGAGGLGREYLETASLINRTEKRWESIIFCDDNKELNNTVVNGAQVYSYSDAKRIFENSIELCIAIGEPSVRELLANRIIGDGIPLATLIYPTNHIPISTVIGKGCYIGTEAFISCNVVIKDNVLIQPKVSVGHDCYIGENTVLSPLSFLSGACIVGFNAYIAPGALVKQATSIGNNTIIGMGSVVYKDIPDEMIAMGNPARPMKRNDEHKVFK